MLGSDVLADGPLSTDLITGPASIQLQATLSGSGLLRATARLIQQTTSEFDGAGQLIAQLGQIQRGVGAQFAGTGSIAFDLLTLRTAATLYGAGGFLADAWRSAPFFVRLGNVTLAGESGLSCDLIWQSSDILWPGINVYAGEQVLYRAASGLEKAMADVDAYRLTQTYAELVRDQWDPYRISITNLPYLAWAMGVNLWEDDWNVKFRRYWTANQWQFKYERGSLLGIKDFLSAAGTGSTCPWGITLRSAIVPPAKFFPGKTLTADERAAYVARFAQLRVYPYVARIQLPYLCFTSRWPDDPLTGRKRHNLNGCFLGPLRKFYPTNSNAGGRYTRTAVLWDRGVSTTLTLRTIISEDQQPYGVTVFDQVTMPGHRNDHYFMREPGRACLPVGHARSQNNHAIFLGALDATMNRVINIPRDGSLELAQAKAQYQTVLPGNQLINIYPDHVADVHPASLYKLYPRGLDMKGTKKYSILFKKYLPPSNAWQFIYERWYLFDPLRVPDYRKASVYMNHARFGIPKYTAEIKVEAFIKWRPWYLRCGGYLRGHTHPQDLRMINKVRRGTTAAMAVRDTVRINTVIKRKINTNDSLPINGSFTVGEYIDA